VRWDSEVAGFGLRVRPGGRKTWIVHRRSAGSVLRRSLGSLEAVTAGEARCMARALIADAPAATTTGLTLRVFGRAFLADCAHRWKPATRRLHAHNLQNLIMPVFGGRRVDAITARDVRSWFADLAVMRPASANRALAVLSSLIKHAETLGLRPENSNPCRGLRRYKSGFKAHYLRDGEYAALGRALAEAEPGYPAAVAAVRFLLYTGARKSEALGLRWEHVHGDRAVLPDSKTGPRTIWLASPARAILDARPRRDDCPWVFASSAGTPVVVDKAWKAVRAAAGLAGLRLHDLRHSHAAVAVNGGTDLRIVAGLLGHADIKATFGYAHLAEAPGRDAATRVSRNFAAMLDAGDGFSSNPGSLAGWPAPRRASVCRNPSSCRFSVRRRHRSRAPDCVRTRSGPGRAAEASSGFGTVPPGSGARASR